MTLNDVCNGKLMLCVDFIDTAARQQAVASAARVLRLSWIWADGLTARSMTLLCPTVVIWPIRLSRASFRLLDRMTQMLPFSLLNKKRVCEKFLGQSSMT